MTDPEQEPPGQDGITLKLVREGVYTWNIHSHAHDSTPEAFTAAVDRALEITRRLESELPHATPKQ